MCVCKKCCKRVLVNKQFIVLILSNFDIEFIKNIYVFLLFITTTFNNCRLSNLRILTSIFLSSFFSLVTSNYIFVNFLTFLFHDDFSFDFFSLRLETYVVLLRDIFIQSVFITLIMVLFYHSYCKI